MSVFALARAKRELDDRCRFGDAETFFSSLELGGCKMTYYPPSNLLPEHVLTPIMEIDPVENRFLLVGTENLQCFDCNYLNHEKDAVGPTKIVSGLSTFITDLHWYPVDCGLITASDFSGCISLWDTNTFQIIDTFNCESACFGHTLTNREILAATNGGMCLFDFLRGVAATFFGRRESFTSCCRDAYSSDLIYGSTKTGGLFCYDVRNPVKHLFTNKSEKGSINSLTCQTYAGNAIVCACFKDGTYGFFNPARDAWSARSGTASEYPDERYRIAIASTFDHDCVIRPDETIVVADIHDSLYFAGSGTSIDLIAENFYVDSVCWNPARMVVYL